MGLSSRRRRRSLPLLVSALVGALAPAMAWAAPNRVGVWLTNSPSPLYYDAGRIERAVRELADAGFTTLYPNVWSRGATFHRSRWAPMEPALAERAPDLDPICRMTEIGRAHV